MEENQQIEFSDLGFHRQKATKSENRFLETRETKEAKEQVLSGLSF